jgi:hypothetical protein
MFPLPKINIQNPFSRKAKVETSQINTHTVMQNNEAFIEADLLKDNKILNIILTKCNELKKTNSNPTIDNYKNIIFYIMTNRLNYDYNKNTLELSDLKLNKILNENHQLFMDILRCYGE